MTFGGGGLGMELNLPEGADAIPWLFGEGPHRFLLEMDSDQWEKFQAQCEDEGIPAQAIGTTASGGRLTIRHDGEVLIDSPVDQLKQHWQRTLEAVWPVE